MHTRAPGTVGGSGDQGLNCMTAEVRVMGTMNSSIMSLTGTEEWVGPRGCEGAGADGGTGVEAVMEGDLTR